MRIQKALFAIFVLCLSCNLIIYGQEVSKADYDKAIDYLDCKTVEFSLNLSDVKGVLEGFRNSCKCKTYPDSKKIKESIPPQAEQEARELSDEIDKIKTADFQPTDKGLIINYLSGGIFTEQEKFPAMYNFANKYSQQSKDKNNVDYIPIERLKEQLKAEFTTLFASTSAPVNTNSNNTNAINTTNVAGNTNTPNNVNKGQNGNTNQASTDERSFFSLINLIYGIYLAFPIFAIIAGIWFYLNLQQISNIINNNRLDNLAQREEMWQNKLKELKPSSNTSSKTDVPIIENKLNNAIAKIEKMEKDIDSLMSRVANQTPLVVIPDTPGYQREKETPKGIFYFPKPNEDGTFNLNSLHQTFKDGDSIYKFTKISDTRANFKIDDRESSTLMALRYPEAVIEPACEAQNPRSDSEKRIVTIQPGVADLIGGDRWQVVKKAVIRYEH